MNLKLTNLNPILEPADRPDLDYLVQKLTFDCPTCRKDRIELFISADNGPATSRGVWRADYLELSCISLTPSINNQGHGCKPCKFHGFLVSGSIVSPPRYKV